MSATASCLICLGLGSSWRRWLTVSVALLEPEGGDGLAVNAELDVVVARRVAVLVARHRQERALGRVGTQSSPREETLDDGVAALDAGGAVAEDLDVVCVGCRARSHAVGKRHADAVELLERAEQRDQGSDEQEGAERTPLVDAHLLPHRVRCAVARVADDEGGVVVDAAAAADELLRDTKSAQHFPHELLRQRAERVPQVVPDLVQPAVDAPCLVLERGCHEVVLVATVERPEPLLRDRQPVVRL
ncbi:hypothetical protein PF008_g31909 [Phytophthora fragariae]|uniref:Uncharacterized protein n=1 Tax=Phytophthora fragariae TaxID=53985 RepID=A0A6G0Q1U3_9STRA|nr:hypothetical protein PF008_g31909 [Phytophthora fragariae]